MKWVTWENVGIDRIGCAWLIQREIDPQAEFRFVPRGAPLRDRRKQAAASDPQSVKGAD
ncbi:MAG: chromate resistance protein [Planctomycetaceae bacterium]|nr:chromate resistance protein [Planctomycetaceae bacterium]